jgi:hypothetical protein
MANSVILPVVVIRPIVALRISVNHRAPSGPAAIPPGSTLGLAIGNSVTAPPVVIRPILLAPISVNHKAPSGPVAIDSGLLMEVGIGYSVIEPLVVIRPILLPSCSAKLQRAVRSCRDTNRGAGRGRDDVFGKCAIVPAVVIRPILFAPGSVNHSAPSEPAATPAIGSLAGVGIGNSVTFCAPAITGQPQMAIATVTARNASIARSRCF